MHEPTDEQVQEFIQAHPGGGTLAEIAKVLGCTRQRALQIVNGAIRRATNSLHRRGVGSTEDLV